MKRLSLRCETIFVTMTNTIVGKISVSLLFWHPPSVVSWCHPSKHDVPRCPSCLSMSRQCNGESPYLSRKSPRRRLPGGGARGLGAPPVALRRHCDVWFPTPAGNETYGSYDPWLHPSNMLASFDCHVNHLQLSIYSLCYAELRGSGSNVSTSLKRMANVSFRLLMLRGHQSLTFFVDLSFKRKPSLWSAKLLRTLSPDASRLFICLQNTTQTGRFVC